MCEKMDILLELYCEHEKLVEKPAFLSKNVFWENAVGYLRYGVC